MLRFIYLFRRFLIGVAASLPYLLMTEIGLADENKSVESAVFKLIHSELISPIVTVMDKSAVAPSGDKHDYFALSPYHWPTTEGGSYEFRDGQVNPEVNSQKYDRVAYFRMGDAVSRLAVGYQMTGDLEYAKRSSAWIRAWFLDPATRMNANLEFSQCIPGRTSGEAIGLIRGMTIIDLVRSERLIAISGALTPAEQKNLYDWVRSFRDWLVTSRLGQMERRALNNHGTWYAAQVASLSVWLGDDEPALLMIRDAKNNRLHRQIMPSGQQPLELLRTKSWDYSVMNAEGLVVLADLGQRLGENVWSFETVRGGGIRTAIDFLVPFAIGDRPWPGKQIRDWEPQRIRPLIVRAGLAFPDAGYAAILGKLPVDDERTYIKSVLLAVDLRRR